MLKEPPDQLPMELLRVYHCCWSQELRFPVITASLMNPPLPNPHEEVVSCIFPLTSMRRNEMPCETPQYNTVPDGGVIDIFSSERQKIKVELPPL